jgi:hypothetical protein
MSAFVVSDKHISALVSYCVLKRVSYYWNKGREVINADNANEIAQKLYQENVKSVNYRYKEGSNASPMAYRFFLTVPNAIGMIKLAQCLDYQSCETPEWADSEAKAILQAIIEDCIPALPGYNEAKWAID